jgi:hypothetical protein
LSGAGNLIMAVSASRVRFVSQCLFLVCMLYLGPLFRKSNSVLENVERYSLNSWWFSFCFLMYRNLSSSFILMVYAFRRVCLAAGKLFGIFILA